MFLLLLLSIWLSSAGRIPAEEMVDRIVAVVNNEIITYLELQRELKPYEDRLKSMGYSQDKEAQMRYKLRNDMIYRLIDQKLADQEIEEKNIKVSEAEIDENIERLKATQMWTDEDLREALAAQGMTIEDYRQTLRNQALREKLVGREIKSKIVITSEDVKAYYQEHAETYSGELRYHLRNIIIVPSTPDKVEAREKMDLVMQKLEAGESFEALARQYSESSLAKEGGDLGKILYADVSPQIQQALKDLNPGDHTSILETDQGFQIFFIEDIVMEGGKRLDEAAPEIEALLYKEAVDQKYVEYIEALKSRSHIKIIK